MPTQQRPYPYLSNTIEWPRIIFMYDRIMPYNLGSVAFAVILWGWQELFVSTYGTLGVN